MAFNVVALCLMPAMARAPSTPAEKRLVGMLVAIGLILAACLLQPLIRHFRWLEARKRPRGERGRALVAQMDSPDRFLASGRVGLSLRGRDLRGEDLKDAFL